MEKKKRAYKVLRQYVRYYRRHDDNEFMKGKPFLTTSGFAWFLEKNPDLCRAVFV